MPAMAAMAAVTAATGKGLYVSPDSVFYVGSARNLLGGSGLRSPPGLQPLGHFPPLFSLVLAAVGRAGIDPLDAARVVNVVVVGATVVLVGLVLRALTGSLPAALIGATLTAAAVDVLTFSAAALSEPLFVLLALAGLVALAVYLQDRRPALLMAAGALVALAVLTRYVGVALTVAGVAVLLWRGAERRGHGAVDAALFGLIALLPAGAWVAWAGSADGTGARTVALHMFNRTYLGQAVRPLARWLVPWPGPPAGPLIALVVGTAAVVFLRRHARPQLAGPMSLSAFPSLSVVFAVVYLAVLVANRVLIDATGRLDARFLMPLHVVAVLLIVPIGYRVGSARTRGHSAVAFAAGALVVAQVVAGVAWAAGGLTDDGTRRRGYTARAWRESSIVDRVRSVEPAAPVYSNGFDAIFFLTGRVVHPIPAEKDYLTNRPNPGFIQELNALRADLERTGGLLVYFDAVAARRSFLPSRVELERALPLEVVATDAVGTVYRLR